MDLSASEIIRGCRLFRRLTEGALAKLERIARTVRFDRGQVIFREGQPCPGIYVVGTGAVRVFKIAPGGKEHVLHFAYAGMTFAEVAAIGRFDCPAFADAVEDTLCALIRRDDFVRLIEEDHGFCIEMMTGMATWVRDLVGLLEDIVLRDATARVARHLIQSDVTEGSGDFELPMRKRDLASHLNLTSETLSRTLRRLAECGLIDMRDRQLHIRDLPKLQQVADGLPPAEFA